MNGKDLRLVSLCKFDEAVLNGFDSQICCDLDFIRVADETISGERDEEGFVVTHYIRESFLKCALTSLSGAL
jgi:hypothetical protein